MTGTTASDDVEAAVRVSQAYIDARNYPRAEEILRAALAENPNNPHLLMGHARTRYYLKDFVAAAYSAYAALSLVPNNEAAMRMYTLAIAGQNRLHEALVMAWRTVTAHPDSHWAHYVYADLLQKVGRPADALTVANEALRLQPTDSDFFVLRGRILKHLGRLAESEADYHDALRLDPDNAMAVNNLGVNRVARGRLSGALRGFLGAGRLDPELGDLARRNIGFVLARGGLLSSLVAVAIGVAVIVMKDMYHDGSPTVLPRIATGICSCALIVAVAWLLRHIPRRLLWAVAKQREVLLFHAVALVGGIATGVLATALGPIGPVVPAATALLIAAVGGVFVGYMAGGRLWG